MTALPHAFFLPTAQGRRFALFHEARGDKTRGRVLYLPPFAEELNASRRVVAQQAAALARAGYAVLQIDLMGCGDSEGAFADATWQQWQADMRAALDWLLARTSGPLWLWGLRAGAMLAHGLFSASHQPANLLLWQPVVSGSQMLQQFLRLHAASQWLGTGQAATPSPRQALENGVPVDVAGYRISPALAQGLSRSQLAPPSGNPGRLVWLEVSSRTPAELGAASATALDGWRLAGWQVQCRAVNGTAFWQTVGPEDAPELGLATVEALTP